MEKEELLQIRELEPAAPDYHTHPHHPTPHQKKILGEGVKAATNPPADS
jgi:hypothetical protein